MASCPPVRGLAPRNFQRRDATCLLEAFHHQALSDAHVEPKGGTCQRIDEMGFQLVALRRARHWRGRRGRSSPARRARTSKSVTRHPVRLDSLPNNASIMPSKICCADLGPDEVEDDDVLADAVQDLRPVEHQLEVPRSRVRTFALHRFERSAARRSARARP